MEKRAAIRRTGNAVKIFNLDRGKKSVEVSLGKSPSLRKLRADTSVAAIKERMLYFSQERWRT